MGTWQGVSTCRELLREAILFAGLKNSHRCVLLTETQLLSPGVLDVVSAVLQSGQVSRLLDADDYSQVVEALQGELKAVTEDPTPEICREHFVARVRNKLHLALCLSSTPHGTSRVGYRAQGFVRLLRRYPSLLAHCCVDWYQPWQEEALFTIASERLGPHREALLKSVPLGKPDAQVDDIVAATVWLHRQALRVAGSPARQGYISTCAFFSFLDFFIELQHAKSVEFTTTHTGLQSILRKVSDAQSLLAEMEESLVSLKPELERAHRQADDIRVVVRDCQESANVARTKATAEKKLVQIAEAAKKKIETEIAGMMGTGHSALQLAHMELDNLRKGDIGELKALKHPPSGVIKVLICALLLFGVPKKKHTLEEAKILVSKPDFIANLMKYDTTRDSAAKRQLHRDLSSKCHDTDFDPDDLKGKSVAASALCAWCLALNTLWNKMSEAEDHRVTVMWHEAEVKRVVASYKLKQDSLAEKEEQLADAEETQESIGTSLAELEKEQTLNQARLQRAKQLVAALGDTDSTDGSSVNRFDGAWVDAVQGATGGVGAVGGNEVFRNARYSAAVDPPPVGAVGQDATSPTPGPKTPGVVGEDGGTFKAEREPVWRVGLDRLMSFKKSGMRKYWKATEKKLKLQMRCVTGDAFLAAASVTYLGSFQPKERSDLVTRWGRYLQQEQFNISPRLDLCDFLTKAGTIRGWVQQGLPQGSTAVESALLIHHTKQIPLIIDPEGQIATVLAADPSSGETLSGSLLAPISEWGEALRDAVEGGKPFLLHDFNPGGEGGSLPPSIWPLLEHSKGLGEDKPGAVYIADAYGIPEISAIHPDFRLLLCCSSLLELGGGGLPDAIKPLVCLVECPVSMPSLEIELLECLMEHEQPAVWARRRSLQDAVVAQGGACEALVRGIAESIADNQGRYTPKLTLSSLTLFEADNQSKADTPRNAPPRSTP